MTQLKKLDGKIENFSREREVQANYQMAILKLKNRTFQIKNSEEVEGRTDMAKENKSELQTDQTRIFGIKHGEEKSEQVQGRLRDISNSGTA